MTSPPDDDPEYEAQLNEVLGTAPTWQGPGDGLPENAEEGEAGAVGKGAHNRSEDGVLAGATSFRTKGLRQERGEQVQNDDEQLEVSLAGEDRALSEDARSISTGDDSPSAQGSEIVLSTPATPSKANGYGSLSPARAFSPSRGFDIRAPHQRLSSYSSLSAFRSSTPSSVHSRMSSLSVTPDVGDITPDDSPNVPWEVVRWTKLRRIEKQALSEIGKRKFGTATVMTVSAVIAVGTTKGLVLIFDFRQNLKHVIGVNTKAAQSGPVTALALSADHTVLLCGHSMGECFTWDLSKPAQPHSHTSALTPEQISQSKRDGHLTGTAILHVDFLGLRHGAFVTADETGMAFVHTLSRKLIVANVSTQRILGRYPEQLGSTSRPIKPHKPSCVLGMRGLPFGSVKFITDEMQLVALLSPYKLVVVSIIPFPQTQLRVARPKRASPEGSILSGCIAWYPCVKPDSKSTDAKEPFTKPKLAYTWDRYLAIRQVTEITEDREDGKEGPPRLHFQLLNEWIGEETIVAIEWLLHQRLLILDTSTMQVTASCDLLMKQIIHADRFSHHMVNFPAVADAYYSSIKTYKNKVFLLVRPTPKTKGLPGETANELQCTEELSVGSLLTWADRVIAIVEADDFIEAINLTTSYYAGKSEKITLGLPADDKERHAVVQDKLTEIIIASLKYTFSHRPRPTATADVHIEVAHQKFVRELTGACIDACLAMDTLHFLFDDVYEIFEEYTQTDVFIDVLEAYILDDRIGDVPPSIVKDITAFFVQRNQHQRLEQVICHISPASLDIDQISAICRLHGLYDAFAYVYNNALKDYNTPMVEFISLVREFFLRPRERSPELERYEAENRPSLAFEAFKVFPYLSYILTGRVYPTGEEMSDSDAYEAKQALYYFLFSGRTLSWPRERGELIRTTTSEDISEPTFPYLRLLLRFDAPVFFQALDEAFEDRFLNGSSDFPSPHESNGVESFGRTINRQLIINIFLEIMAVDFPSEIIYLYMFIARNLPKYPQFILLSGSTIEAILLALCSFGQTEMAEEAQLAAEYLLSVFKPGDSEKMIQAYQDARFYRILKATLRAEGRFTELLDVYLRDEDQGEIFDCVDGLLRVGGTLTGKQREAITTFAVSRLDELAGIDTVRTAEMFERQMADKQMEVVRHLQRDPATLFLYLYTIISEKAQGDSMVEPTWMNVDVRELYISLLCEFRPGELTKYVELLSVDKFRIEKILPVMEKFNVIDAIVMVLWRAGMSKEAMQKVIIHLSSLHQSLSRMIQAHETMEAERIVADVSRLAFVAADLCETFSKETMGKSGQKRSKRKEPSLNEAEQMWLTLLETVVGITRDMTMTLVTRDKSDQSDILDSLRVVVQDIFTRLLTLSSSTTSSINRRSATPTVSFLAILRRFLQNLASSPLTDLRSVLSSIFDAYRYEQQLIQVTSKLVEADLFQDLLCGKREREKGWRPTSPNCMACGRILFGPGAKGGIFSKWERKRLEALERKQAEEEARVRVRETNSVPTTPNGKGKGKSVDVLVSPVTKQIEEPFDIEGDIVVFGCGHAFHRGCLAEVGGIVSGEGLEGTLDMRLRCIVCETHSA